MKSFLTVAFEKGVAKGEENMKSFLTDAFEKGVAKGEENMKSFLTETFEKGVAEGKIEGRIEGKAEGKAEGEAQGENRFAKLIELLLKDGKSEEVKEAAVDSVRRKELFALYGLE